jgi:hypothetical protein
MDLIILSDAVLLIKIVMIMTAGCQQCTTCGVQLNSILQPEQHAAHSAKGNCCGNDKTGIAAKNHKSVDKTRFKQRQARKPVHSYSGRLNHHYTARWSLPGQTSLSA